jgi:hypothetical protein
MVGVYLNLVRSEKKRRGEHDAIFSKALSEIQPSQRGFVV